MEPLTPADKPSDPDQSEPQERWEIADQWRQGWRALKWGFTGLVTIGTLVVVGQVFLFYQMFSEIHWLLGWAFAAAFTGLCFFFIALPLMRFLRSPAIAEPPKVDLSADDISADDIARRIAYDAQYLKGMARNPALIAKQAEILNVQEELRLLKVRAASTDIETSPGDDDPSNHTRRRNVAAKELGNLERDRIAPLLSSRQTSGQLHPQRSDCCRCFNNSEFKRLG